jgi:uncharacterized membrane protein
MMALTGIVFAMAFIMVQFSAIALRLGKSELNIGYARDQKGFIRLIVPMPTWEDFLTLAFDEIRQYGATSVQVMRRLRSALIGLANSLPSANRADAVQRYLKHLDGGDRALAARS